MKMKIKTGEMVRVLAGKDKGKTGKILQVFPRDNRVVVEGVNIVKKHLRSRKQGEPGQRIELPGLIHASNVAKIEETGAEDTKPKKRTASKKAE